MSTIITDQRPHRQPALARVADYDPVTLPPRPSSGRLDLLTVATLLAEQPPLPAQPVPPISPF